MNNLEYYEKLRSVPENAKKTIQGGNLKGFTDINPMWRIHCLTEAFGPCGFGWYTDILQTWTEEGKDGKVAAFCKINLFIKIGEEWSKPIQGIGGSMLVNIFKGKPETSDECYKMAYTDAISVACKALGIGADVYWAEGRSKYDTKRNEPEPQSPNGQDGQEILCSRCGKTLPKEVKMQSGKVITGQAFAAKYGGLCPDCRKSEAKQRSERPA
ncbi:MAG: hypothetical protein HFE60_07930 [Anaerotignum sp.]|nr:hypothetical protein [Anaerotignum sp.]